MKINDARARILSGDAFARLVRACVFGFAVAIAAHVESAFAQFTDKITTTPIFIQDGFGPAGDLLPYDGLSYCFPTSFAMDLSYLGGNGFSQIAPGNPNSAQALNLVKILGGFMQTDPIQGTLTSADVRSGIEEYLAAKGIGTSNYAIATPPLPTISTLAALNQPGTVVTLGIGFYDSSGNRAGGHAVTLLSQGIDAQGQSSPNTVVINNPEPSALAPSADTTANALQYLNTIPTSGNLTKFGAIEMDPNQYPAYYAGSPTSVIEAVTGLTINPSQLASNNPTPATWNISGQQSVELNGGNLTVLAPIAGTGGLLKGSGGVLELEAPDISTGTNTIVNGTLRSDVASGLPFGTGPILLETGALVLAPAPGSANVSLTGASSSSSTFQFFDGGTLALALNGNHSLAFTLGGNTNGTTPNFSRQGSGTLVIAAGGGTSDLGMNEQVIANGSGGNLPSLTNGIVSPYIVAQDNDSAGSGDFLTYGANGFAKAAYTEASATAITAAGSAAVFEANISQTIPHSTTAQVFALKVDAVTVGGGSASVLKIGTQTGGHAGVILNGGTISATDLAFGSAEGLIYTSNAGGTISSIVQGTGGLTTFGPGALTLTGANTYSGATNINSGTLIAANTTGSATGTGAVTVHENATLEVSGVSAVAGSSSGTIVKGGSTLLLNGGTFAGPLTVTSGSSGSLFDGYLLGSGTISGPATVSGVIGSPSTDLTAPPFSGVESIIFSGSSVTLDSPAIYSWRLNALTDNPSEAGTDWSLLQFTGPSGTINMGASSSSQFSFTLDLGVGVPDPNSGDAFWDESHQWLVADAPNTFNNLWFHQEYPTFEQGSFALSPDAQVQNLYLDYTPAPEPAAAALFAAAALAVVSIRRRSSPSHRSAIEALPRIKTAGKAVRFIAINILLLLSADSAPAVGTLFVSTNGNDKNAGTQSQPFQHIGRALSAAKPGDIVCVDDGVYHEAVKFSRSGTADHWITLRPLNEVNVRIAPPHVTIAPAGGCAISTNGMSYIWIEGFEINGALWGIGSSEKMEHHTVVTNNLVHDTAASGIQLNNGDYRTITENVVHDCAKTWKGCGSGISIYTSTALDTAPGPHNVIARNVCYSNSNPPGGTDGNGIIFDDGKHSQYDKVVYTPNTLIENNVVYFNGGAGISVFHSVNVTVRNNTAYWNRQLPNKFTWRGELSCVASDNIVWVNNLAWTNPSLEKDNTALLDAGSGTGVVWMNNVTYSGTPGKASFNHHGPLPAGNFFGADPLLVHPPTDLRLQPKSPAVGAGVPGHGVPAVDLAGNPRSGPVDIGAYAAGANIP